MTTFTYSASTPPAGVVYQAEAPDWDCLPRICHHIMITYDACPETLERLRRERAEVDEPTVVIAAEPEGPSR